MPPLYDTPLFWRSESGKEGTELATLPPEEEVYFYDALGPVYRLAGIVEGRWWVFGKLDGRRVRITRLLDRDGVYHYIVPGTMGALVCRHSNCDPGQCATAAQVSLAMVNEVPVP